MQLAKVVGNVVATSKDSALEGRKLLVLQPVAPSGAPSGAPLVAVDGVGVGAGEEVFFVRGREASFAFLPDQVVADAAIVGKVDSIDVGAQGDGARPPSPSSGAPRRSPQRPRSAKARSGEPSTEEVRGSDGTGERASNK
jgi:ethanolamine utilization protein EutN